MRVVYEKNIKYSCEYKFELPRRPKLQIDIVFYRYTILVVKNLSKYFSGDSMKLMHLILIQYT